MLGLVDLAGEVGWDLVAVDGDVLAGVDDRGHVDLGAGGDLGEPLLDRKGRRLAQVDVWRTDAGGWRAGAWSQCID